MKIGLVMPYSFRASGLQPAVFFCNSHKPLILHNIQDVTAGLAVSLSIQTQVKRAAYEVHCPRSGSGRYQA